MPPGAHAEPAPSYVAGARFPGLRRWSPPSSERVNLPAARAAERRLVGVVPRARVTSDLMPQEAQVSHHESLLELAGDADIALGITALLPFLLRCSPGLNAASAATKRWLLLSPQAAGRTSPESAGGWGTVQSASSHELRSIPADTPPLPVRCCAFDVEPPTVRGDGAPSSIPPPPARWTRSASPFPATAHTCRAPA